MAQCERQMRIAVGRNKQMASRPVRDMLIVLAEASGKLARGQQSYADPAARRTARFGLAVAAATCLLICIVASLVPANLAALEARPRSILVIDDANAKAPFYYEAYSRLRTIVNARANAPVSLYTESLDLTRFRGADYEQSLRQLLQSKYRDRPIGLLVTIGSGALEQVLRWRPTLWPSIPVAFGMVDEPTAARLNLPSDVTGFFIKLRLPT
jgi:hypothetical protein